MSKTRETLGSQYRLTVVEETAVVPPTVDKMFQMVLDEMDAKGNFTFHAKGPLDPSIQTGPPRITTRLEGDKIATNLRWGEGPENSIAGFLYVPSGRKPVEVMKEMGRRLDYLNGDHWSVLGLNGSASASVQTVHPAPEQITVASSSSPTQTSLMRDRGIARTLFELSKKPNATIMGYTIRDHLHRHFPDPGNRAFVSETIARLEGKGILRRVRIEDTGEWQFTEAFIETQGASIEGYTRLPAVSLNRSRPTVERKPAAANAAAAPLRSSAAAPVTRVREQSAVAKLAELYAEKDRLVAERQSAQAQLEAATKLVASIDDKLGRVMSAIEQGKAAVTTDELWKIVLNRSNI